MGDKHKKKKNFKSAWVFYQQAEENYKKSQLMITNQDLLDELSELIFEVETKAEKYKKKYLKK